VENYFNYFTEIEEHFQRRRGGILLLSTLDWALIETWKDAGIPLEAVLRGIDAAFDRYERRPTQKKVNSLAYCSQEVLSATEEMKEAAVGATVESASSKAERDLPVNEIVGYLRKNAAALEKAKLPDASGISVTNAAKEIAGSLQLIADELEGAKAVRLEDLERRLTMLEEKLFAVLLAATGDLELTAVRAQADRELAPYRGKMQGPQIEQLQKQYLHKKLLAKYDLPRLSLFYM
jgi:hypothetical protein